MLNFDPERYVSIQTGAVQLAPRIDRAVGDLLAAGATNVVFAGTGGAQRDGCAFCLPVVDPAFL